MRDLGQLLETAAERGGGFLFSPLSASAEAPDFCSCSFRTTITAAFAATSVSESFPLTGTATLAICRTRKDNAADYSTRDKDASTMCVAVPHTLQKNTRLLAANDELALDRAHLLEHSCRPPYTPMSLQPAMHACCTDSRGEGARECAARASFPALCSVQPPSADAAPPQSASGPQHSLRLLARGR